MPTLAAQLLPEMFTLPQVAMAFEAYLNIVQPGGERRRPLRGEGAAEDSAR